MLPSTIIDKVIMRAEPLLNRCIDRLLAGLKRQQEERDKKTAESPQPDKSNTVYMLYGIEKDIANAEEVINEPVQTDSEKSEEKSDIIDR